MFFADTAARIKRSLPPIFMTVYGSDNDNEGTRVRDEGLGTPKRGAARLAIENGAPIVPAAITGTERRRFHLPLPRQ